MFFVFVLDVTETPQLNEGSQKTPESLDNDETTHDIYKPRERN